MITHRPVPPAWFPPAAVAAGAVTATAAVGHRPGIGVTLAVAAYAGALLPVVRSGMRPREWLLVGLGSALAVMPAVRDAEWLVALDLLMVGALGCLVLTGVHGATSLLRAAVSIPARLVDAPGFLARGAGRYGRPLTRPAVRAGLRGGFASVALLAVFGALFGSADAAFRTVVARLLPEISFELLHLRLLVAACGTLLCAAALLAHLVPVRVAAGAPRPRARLEWLVPVVALDVLFAAFVAVQLAVLFGGHEHVLSTAGLTYAEYARSGFFQLLVVAALTLAVVAGAARTAGPDERVAVRLALGPLCLLTLVVLASALRRLWLYQSAFGLSRDRIVAHVAIWTVAAVFLLVIAAGATWRAGWLAPAACAVVAAALLGLNLVNPDLLVARDQVARHGRTGRFDTDYVATLSADAVPALVTLPAPLRACVLALVRARLDEPAGWPAANLSRARAARLLRGVHVEPADCTAR